MCRIGDFEVVEPTPNLLSTEQVSLVTPQVRRCVSTACQREWLPILDPRRSVSGNCLVKIFTTGLDKLCRA